MGYQWSICDPLHKQLIQKGAIEREDIALTFKHYPWVSELAKLAKNPSDEIHYSPSIDFIDISNNRAITFSAVADNSGYVFYVFYQRPEQIKKWFGLVDRLEPKHVTDLLDQSFDSSQDLLNMFLNQEFNALQKLF